MNSVQMDLFLARLFPRVGSAHFAAIANAYAAHVASLDSDASLDRWFDALDHVASLSKIDPTELTDKVSSRIHDRGIRLMYWRRYGF
jgi:hypothetical protein